MGWVRGAVRAWSRASGAPASAGFSGCPCGALLCLPVSSCMHGRCCVAVPELLLALPMCQGAAGIPALPQGHRGRSKPRLLGLLCLAPASVRLPTLWVGAVGCSVAAGQSHHGHLVGVPCAGSGSSCSMEHLGEPRAMHPALPAHCWVVGARLWLAAACSFVAPGLRVLSDFPNALGTILCEGTSCAAGTPTDSPPEPRCRDTLHCSYTVRNALHSLHPCCPPQQRCN